MRLSYLLSLPAVLSSIVSAVAIERRDVEFYNVRTKMHKDMSGRAGDPKAKYFRKLMSRALPRQLLTSSLLQMKACKLIPISTSNSIIDCSLLDSIHIMMAALQINSWGIERGSRHCRI